MKTTPVLLCFFVICLVPVPARAGLLDWISSAGEAKQKLVDKSRSHYREAMEQSGIREDEMRERGTKEPVISNEEHLGNVNKLRVQWEDALRGLLVTAAKLEDKLRSATGAERQKIQQGIDKVMRQVPKVEQEIRNCGGDPMNAHLNAGRQIDALRRDSRNKTPVTEDGADLFLPGFGSAWDASSRSREDARRTARNAGRSSGAPERVKVANTKPKTTKAPRRIRPRPGHNPAEGSHH